MHGVSQELSRSEELNFSCTSTNETLKFLSTSVNPLWHLFASNSVRVLTSIESSEKGWALERTTSKVEGETNKSTSLVGVQVDLDESVNTGNESLEVLTQKSISLSFSNFHTRFNIRSSVSVADGKNTNSIKIGSKSKSLKLLYKAFSSWLVPVWSSDLGLWMMMVWVAVTCGT